MPTTLPTSSPRERASAQLTSPCCRGTDRVEYDSLAHGSGWNPCPWRGCIRGVLVEVECVVCGETEYVPDAQPPIAQADVSAEDDGVRWECAACRAEQATFVERRRGARCCTCGTTLEAGSSVCSVCAVFP